MQKNIEEESELQKSKPTLKDKPPVFKSWKQMYAFVLGAFATLVILFYIFTITFS